MRLVLAPQLRDGVSFQKARGVFEGHLRAFEHFGGVSHRLVTIISSQQSTPGRGTHPRRATDIHRVSQFWPLRSHFCTPAQGHEKVASDRSTSSPQFSWCPSSGGFLQALILSTERACGMMYVSFMGKPWHWRGLEGCAHVFPASSRSSFACCVTRQVHLTPYSQVVYDPNRYSVPTGRPRRERCSSLSVSRRDRRRSPGHCQPPTLFWTRAGCVRPAASWPCWNSGQAPSSPLDHCAPSTRGFTSLPSLLRLLKGTGGRTGVNESVRVLRLHQEHPAPAH